MLLPHIYHDNGILRDEIAAVLEIFSGHAWATKGGRAMPSEQLFDYSVDVWKRLTVGELRKTIRTNDSVQFGLCSSLHIGEERHGDKKAAQG